MLHIILKKKGSITVVTILTTFYNIILTIITDYSSKH